MGAGSLMHMRAKNIMRRVLILPTAFLGSYIMLFAGLLLSQLSRTFSSDEVVCPMLAMSFVLCGSLVAPVTERKYAAPALYLLGVVLSWDILSSLTEFDSVTPNYKPMIFTYVIGFITALLIVVWDKKKYGKVV